MVSACLAAVPSGVPAVAAARPYASGQARFNPRSVYSLEMVSPRAGWALSSRFAIGRTLNGGRVWADATPLLPVSDRTNTAENESGFFAFSATRAGFIVKGPAGGCYFWRTEDGGKSWSRSFVPADPPSFPHLFADGRAKILLARSDPTIGGASARVVAVSSDGGASWTDVHGAVISSILGFSGGVGFGVAAPASEDGGPSLVAISRSAGRTWQLSRVPHALGPGALLSAIGVGVGAPGSATVAAVFTNREGGHVGFDTYRTVDGGREWTASPLVAPRSVSNDAPYVAFVNPRDGWLGFNGASTTRPLVYSTVDGGRHWDRFRSRVSPFQPQFVTRNVGFMVNPVARHHVQSILVTHDAGRRWTTVVAR
jgi:photosystem II stability/assembly factor-like uncharacterized protein